MPLIFIHGVNTRDSSDYRKDVAARDELIRRLVLEPLAAKGSRFKQIEIVNPYWGKYGVDFRWKQATLPDVRTLEHLGSNTFETPKSDFEITATIKDLRSTSANPASVLESLGTSDEILKGAAVKDLTRFIEAVLSPIILSEMNLSSTAEVMPETEGVIEALVVLAGLEVATDSNVQKAVSRASSDEEVIRLLKEKIQVRFQQLLMNSKLVSSKNTEPVDSGLESLGPNWIEELKERVGELIDRAKDAPMRAATVAALDQFREGLNRNLTQFLGDVFVYLNERDGSQGPGLIVSTVLEAIKTAPRHHENEPLIVITHSMGGNILYDILTHYAPDLRVDIWVSVGGQVGQFEEMKIFKASDKGIGTPKKVTGLKPEKVAYWLNIYDPADVLSFKVAPVFADVDADIEFLTGASAFKSHGAYFKRASFYQMLRERIEGAVL